MTRVKICGLTNEADVRTCAAAGAHALGFVVEYPLDVPWNLDRATAQRLLRAVPPLVARVIVVGGDPGVVIGLTELLRPHAVQLHGDEPPPVTARIVAALHALGTPAIKALRYSAETGRWEAPDGDPFRALQAIEEAGADAVLLDAASAARPAGTGRSVDWATARALRDRARVPVILAGGLRAENVEQAIVETAPWAVDVISGVERIPGRKDEARVRAFLEAAGA
jgi:phosphoribosylanthranilate isomerase